MRQCSNGSSSLQETRLFIIHTTRKTAGARRHSGLGHDPAAVYKSQCPDLMVMIRRPLTPVMTRSPPRMDHAGAASPAFGIIAHSFAIPAEKRYVRAESPGPELVLSLYRNPGGSALAGIPFLLQIRASLSRNGTERSFSPGVKKSRAGSSHPRPVSGSTSGGNPVREISNHISCKIPISTDGSSEL